MSYSSSYGIADLVQRQKAPPPLPNQPTLGGGIMPAQANGNFQHQQQSNEAGKSMAQAYKNGQRARQALNKYRQQRQQPRQQQPQQQSSPGAPPNQPGNGTPQGQSGPPTQTAPGEQPGADIAPGEPAPTPEVTAEPLGPTTPTAPPSTPPADPGISTAGIESGGGSDVGALGGETMTGGGEGIAGGGADLAATGGGQGIATGVTGAGGDALATAGTGALADTAGIAGGAMAGEAGALGGGAALGATAGTAGGAALGTAGGAALGTAGGAALGAGAGTAALAGAGAGAGAAVGTGATLAAAGEAIGGVAAAYPWLAALFALAAKDGGRIDPGGIAQGLATGGQPHKPEAIGAGSRGGRSHFSQKAGGLFRGPVKGTTPGRADSRNTAVGRGSYVIPADVVSGLGQGNTDAGHAQLRGILNKRGPLTAQPFAQGGSAGADPVPVRLSDGEFVYGPEEVAHLGGGDAKRGAASLDKLVHSVRASTIDNLKRIPAPR